MPAAGCCSSATPPSPSPAAAGTRWSGRNIFEFICPDDIAEVRSKFDSGEVLRTPLRMRRVRFRFRHADGQWRWLESLAVNALHDPLLATIIVHSRDVSEDVALEEALRRRERRFSTLTEKSEDLIVVLGADGKAVFESASISRIFGFRPRELTSRRILRLIHPSHRRRAIGVGRELMAHHGTERRLEFMVRDGADGYRWIEAILVDLIEDPDVNGLLINARDVTARKLAEAERDSVLEEASVFVWEQDLATRRIRWLRDSDALRWLGTLAGEHDERDWERRVHADDVDRVLEAYARLESGASTTVSVEYRLQDGHGQWRRVLERGQLAGSNPRTAGRLVRGVCIDITERRRIEDALARSREQFRLALECAQIGFYEWDVLADTLTGLDDWCAAHGVPPEAGRPGHDARWESHDPPRRRRCAAARVRRPPARRDRILRSRVPHAHRGRALDLGLRPRTDHRANRRREPASRGRRVHGNRPSATRGTGAARDRESPGGHRLGRRHRHVGNGTRRRRRALVQRLVRAGRPARLRRP